MNQLSNILNDRKDSIPYRAKIAKEIGSVTGAILLQQISYWWSVKGGKPFYKFKEPCASGNYNEGDSWCEELGFTRSEFDTAFAKIGKKIKRSDLREMTLEDPFVWAYTDMARNTFYVFNASLFEQLLNTIYVNPNPTLLKRDVDLRKSKSRVIKSGNPALAYTETTTENTIEKREGALEISLVPHPGVNSSPVTTPPVAPVLSLDEKYPNTEDKAEVIYQKCIAQLKADQTLFSRIILKARINITKNQFVVELRKWVEHYIHDSKFFANAHKRMDFGRGNMVNWLSSEKTRDQYSKLNAAQTTGKLKGESPFAKLAKLRQSQQTA